MAGFIQNILWNSVEGFVEAGTRTAGEYAGNALIKAGDMIENGGRGVGNSIEKKATNYGSSISGQTYQPSSKPLPSTARKPIIKRSNSTPASNKPTTAGSKSVGPRPMGANKYPDSNQINGAKKTIGNGTSTAKSTVSSIGGGASKSLTSGVTAGGQKALSGATSSLNKSPLPKPSPNTRSNSLPKPYNSSSNSSFPSSEKKTIVKPGQPKPFTPPVEQKRAGSDAGGKKPAYPGMGSKVPVQNQKPRYKPLPRLGAQVGRGETMTHLAV